MAFDPDWEVCRTEGESVALGAPGDWAQLPGWELFSGTLSYKTELNLPGGAGEFVLSLGRVGDIAEVILDRKSIGVRMWEPYEFSLGSSPKESIHILEIRVTNSMANAYEGAQIPSGLMGPVGLVLRRR